MGFIVNYDNERDIVWLKTKYIKKGDASIHLNGHEFPLDTIVNYICPVHKPNNGSEESEPVAPVTSAIKALEKFQEFNSDSAIEKDIKAALIWLRGI